MKPTMTEEERILTLEEKVARLQFDVYALQSKMDLMADRKTEPTCDTCRHKGVEGCEQPCLGCGCCGLYEPKDEPQTERSE